MHTYAKLCNSGNDYIFLSLLKNVDFLQRPDVNKHICTCNNVCKSNNSSVQVGTCNYLTEI